MPILRWLIINYTQKPGKAVNILWPGINIDFVVFVEPKILMWLCLHCTSGTSLCQWLDSASLTFFVMIVWFLRLSHDIFISSKKKSNFRRPTFKQISNNLFQNFSFHLEGLFIWFYTTLSLYLIFTLYDKNHTILTRRDVNFSCKRQGELPRLKLAGE